MTRTAQDCSNVAQAWGEFAQRLEKMGQPIEAEVAKLRHRRWAEEAERMTVFEEEYKQTKRDP